MAQGSTGHPLKTRKSQDFYGKDADDEITKVEGSFGALMNELRAYSRSGPANDVRVPRLVAHLSVRTRQLRQTLMEAVDLMLQGLRGLLTRESALQGLVADTFREKLKLISIAQGVPEHRAKEAIALLGPHLSDLVEQNMPDPTALVDNVISMARARFPEAMTNAHQEALSKNPTAEPRANLYAQFNWCIVITKSPVVLGDTACVFETRGKRRFKPLNDKNDDVKQILLPVASDRILVGTRNTSCPELDEPLLNKAFVRCSHEFFVSAARAPPGSALLASIGIWSGVLSIGEVQKIVDELKEEIFNR